MGVLIKTIPTDLLVNIINEQHMKPDITTITDWVTTDTYLSQSE